MSIENLSILVVEDNEINMEVIEFMLQSEGAIVYKAKNGKEAVEQFDQINDLDLILMDLRTPIMDGYEATIQIRKKDSNPCDECQCVYARYTEMLQGRYEWAYQ